jgi:hypothetical protein
VKGVFSQKCFKKGKSYRWWVSSFHIPLSRKRAYMMKKTNQFVEYIKTKRMRKMLEFISLE